jgi:hypothetical protein
MSETAPAIPPRPEEAQMPKFDIVQMIAPISMMAWHYTGIKTLPGSIELFYLQVNLPCFTLSDFLACEAKSPSHQSTFGC